MTKIMKKSVLLSTILFSLLLFTSIYVSLTTPVYAAEATTQEKGLTILNDVVGVDLTKYVTKPKDYPQDSYRGVVPQKNVRYTLESDRSKLDIFSTFANGNLRMIDVLESEGLPYTTKSVTSILEMAKDFLSQYQTYSGDSFYGELKSMLDNIDADTELTKTVGNIKLEVTPSEDLTTFKWTYTSNSVEAPSKCVALGYKNGFLKYFIDNWSLYKIGSTSINLSEEEAKVTAMERARAFSWKMGADKNIYEVKDFNVTQAMVMTTVFSSALNAEKARNEDLLTLYPMRLVWVSLDKFYPGNVYGIEVHIWADTKEIFHVQERFSTLDYPAIETVTIDESAIEALSSQALGGESEANSMSVGWIALPALVALTFGTASFVVFRKKSVAWFYRLPKLRWLRISGLLFCLLISSMVMLAPISAVLADKYYGRATIWGSESSGDTSYTGDEDWLTGWIFRKKHTINSAAGAGTNYTVRITVDYDSATDSGGSAYVMGHCQPDFEDIRFTDNDGTTLLDYWLEKEVDEEYATFWVKIADDLSTNDVNIFIYYGNSTVESISNGDHTFLFFDDFDDGSFDTAKWDVDAGSPTESGGELHVEYDGGTREVVSSDDTFSINSAIRASVALNGSWAHAVEYYDDGSNYGLFARGNADWWHATANDGSGGEIGFGTNDNTYHIWEHQWTSGNSTITNVDGSEGTNTRTSYVMTSGDAPEVRFYAGNGATKDVHCNYVLVRKFVTPEPTHGAWIGSTGHKTQTEITDQRNVAQNISDRFSNYGYDSSNYQGSGSIKASILANISYNEENYPRVAVVDFDHGVGRNDSKADSGVFHFMFEDNIGNMNFSILENGTDPDNWVNTHMVYDMDIYNNTIENKTFFAFISTCMSANLTNPMTDEKDWQGEFNGTARGMPFAWTHRRVENGSIPGNIIDPSVNMSINGYFYPDDGDFVYLGFPLGSAALSQIIDTEYPTVTYKDWILDFFRYALEYDMPVIQALDHASYFHYDCGFGDIALYTDFNATWPFYNYNSTANPPQWEWQDQIGANSTMAVYGNGNIKLYQPLLTVKAYDEYSNPIQADVEIDDENVGTTGVSKRVTGVGTHTVKVTRSGYTFKNITDGTSTYLNNPINIPITSDMNLTANFECVSGWLAGWQYRKNHTINYASGAGTNYPVKIEVHYDPGNDTGEDVYLNGKCQFDFDDLRFTDDDGETLLDYWCQDKTNSSNAVFWVEVGDNLNSSNAVICVYYGNSLVNTTSNGTATFTRWDDFDDGYSVGNSPKASRGWTVNKDGSDTVEIDNNPSGSGKVLKIDEGGGAQSSGVFNDLSGSTWESVAIHFKLRLDTTDLDHYIYGLESGTSRITIDWGFTSGYAKWYDGSSYNDYSPALSYSADTWYKIAYNINGTNGDYVDIIKNGTEHIGDWRSTPTSGIDEWRILVAYFDAGKIWIDDFFVRKYVDPEPTHGSWGTEEELM